MVEGHDHPVPVWPDRPRLIFFVAVGVGVAGGIEPMAAPTLAIVRRGEKPLDNALVSVGPRVSDEVLNFLDARRQADEIEAQPSNQRDSIRLGRWLQVLLLQMREDEI